VNGRPTETGGASRRVSARDFVAIIFRRKWVILGVFVLTTVVTAAMILSQPTYYESTGKVLIKRGVKDNLFDNNARSVPWEEDLASEIETAKSATVIVDAQRRLDATRRELGRPRYVIDPGGVDAAVVGESNVLAISYQAREPVVCAEVADAVLAAYTEHRRTAYGLPYPGEFFDSETRGVQAELDQLQAERRDLLAGAELTDGGSSDRQALLARQLSARAGINSAERDVAEMREQLQQMRAYLDDPVNSPDIPFNASDLGSDVAVVDIKRQLIGAQVKYSELAAIYQPDQPDLVRMRDHIAELRKLLDREVRNRIRVSEMQLAVKEAELRQTKGEMVGAESRVRNLPAQEARLADLNRRIEGLQKQYGHLVEKSELAKIQQATSPDLMVLLLSSACKPYPKNTKDYVRIALAPIFSLIVGIGLAFFIDSLDTSVKSPREAEEMLELPVLATLTERKRR
jgi:succinoglycan biosynthesis transport protein ExoP